MSRHLVTTVKIVNIESKQTKNVVYNFHVEEDESYILNGLISHNCRCALAPATDSLPPMADDGSKEFDEWLNS